MLPIVRSTLFHKNNTALFQRICSSNPRLISEEAYRKIKLQQARMQCDEDVPVYLKCGTRDKILYWITVGFVLYNTLQSIKLIRRLHAQY